MHIHPSAAAGEQAHYRGVIRCGSAWECPTCWVARRQEAAAELSGVVARHCDNGGQVYLVTLTLRHGMGDDLGAMAECIADGWRYLWGGRGGAARRKVAETCRVLEVTRGKNGWHPHLHALLFVRDPIDCEEWAGHLFERWADFVEDRLGPRHVPSWERGTDVRPLSTVPGYLSKIGLEITDAGGTKIAAKGESPLGILDSACGDASAVPRAVRTWLDYGAGMRGRKFLTWSRGLRDLREAAAADIESEQAQIAELPVVAVLPGELWDRLRYQDGAALQMLEAAESGGLDAVVSWVAKRAGPHAAAKVRTWTENERERPS